MILRLVHILVDMYVKTNKSKKKSNFFARNRNNWVFYLIDNFLVPLNK